MDGRIGLAIALIATAALGAGFAVPGGASGPGEATPRAGCTYPYETTDATGNEVRIDVEPQRVVTLNPSAAQTMWEIGAREKIVGLTKYATYLEGAESRTNVSSSAQIVVVETVVDLEPDLVLAPNSTGDETVEQLRDVGLTVYHFREAEDVEGIYEKTRTIGRLTGECSGAESTVSWMRERVETVRQAVSTESRPDVLYAFFGYTAGSDTFIHHIIETAGGNNVATEYGVTGYRQLNPEVVVEADPDWIIRNSRDPTMPEGAPFNSTTAVRDGQIVVIPIEHLNQPAPRVVHAITTLARHFHPEAYAAANETRAEPTIQATAERPISSPSPTTGTDGQPGFGIGAGLIAVGIVLLCLRGQS